MPTLEASTAFVPLYFFSIGFSTCEGCEAEQMQRLSCGSFHGNDEKESTEACQPGGANETGDSD